MLHPNNKQSTRMHETANAARWAYNWAVETENENYQAGGKYIGDMELRRKFTLLKHDREYYWLNNISNNATKQAIRDASVAFRRFFENISNLPRYKCKKKSRPSFYVDTSVIKFTSTHVKLQKIACSKNGNRGNANWVRLAEVSRIPTGATYCNPRITYDGLHWWISVGVQYDEVVKLPVGDGIGIDLGIKELAVTSDGYVYKNINKTKAVRQIIKRQKHLQRKVSKKYLLNSSDGFKKTKNIIKYERQILKLYHRLTGIRYNYLHQSTASIIKREPSFIVLEDLNLLGMAKNKHLSKAVQEQGLGEFVRQIQYKSNWHGIKIVVANRFFPSSKTCSECGCVKKDLKLSERIYKCECGLIIDRDLNAAINLEKYGRCLV